MDKDRPGLVLLDEKGEPRAALGVGKGGAGLGLYGQNGKARAELEVGSTAQP